MGDNMKDNCFIKVCEKDIKELYNMIEIYLPGYEIKHLNQSAIYDENKKIICRSIKNDKKENIGHEIAIYCYDNRDIIKLIKRLNSIRFEKLYHENNCYIKEKVKISFSNNTIERCFSYSKDSKKENIIERYDVSNKDSLIDYFNSSSIEDMISNIKVKNKTRKRD